MSGAWDRPPRGSDGDWPAEDLSSRPADADTWGSGDLWPEERRDGSPWGEWASTVPPDDDVSDEPLRTLSDPWAESWSDAVDEPAAAEASAAPVAPPADRPSPSVPERWTDVERSHPPPEEGPARREWEPSHPDAHGWEASVAADTGSAGPTPEDEPPSHDARPSNEARSPEVAPDQRRWARVEPWQPDSDPWGVVVPDVPAADEPTADLAEQPTLDIEPPTREPDGRRDLELADAAPASASAWARTPDTHQLDWLPEPIPIADPDSERPAPTLDDAGIEIDEPARHADAATAEVVPSVESTETDAAPTVHPGLASETEPTRPPDVDAEEQPNTEASDDAAPWVAPADEPASAEDAAGTADGPQSAWVARWFARRRTVRDDDEGDHDVDVVTVASPASDDASADEAPSVTATEPDTAGGDGERPAPAEPVRASEPVELDPPAPVWVTTPEPLAPSTADRHPASVDGDVERAAAIGRSHEAPSESTQVLPTDWEPPAPSRGVDRELEPVAGSPRTRLAEPEPDLDEDLEAQPSTAEQAVPWLIGFILLLAGMVIVLLALIFAGDESLAGAGPSPSPTNVAVVTPPSEEPSASPPGTPVPTPTPAPSISAAATPTPLPVPEYGPLAMVYQGRSAALAPIYLLRRDFTLEADPTVMAQDASLDVRRFAWAPDGTRGAGLLANVLVSIEEGAEKRRLGDDITTVTFGADRSTVYAVRVVQDGTDDVANVLAIDFASGDTTELASISYARPTIGEEGALEEAQFADDGGAVRLYWMDDGMLRLWVLGAGSWNVTPEGEVSELDRETVPLLFAPRGGQRVSVSDGATSSLVLLDKDGEEVASTTVQGLVSHLRWSPTGERVVFTLGRLAPGGGILQDLFLWDLEDGQAPTQLTNTGANFGAEWLGTASIWRDE